MPLPWRHVQQLLKLPPGERRDALQRKAAERGWGLEELAAAIPRKREAPAGAARGGPALREAEDGGRRAAAGRAVRRGVAAPAYGSKAWSGDDWLGGKVGAAGPGGLKARLAEAREVLREVRRAVDELEARLKRFEAEMGEGRPAGPAKLAAGPGRGEVGASPVAAAPRLNPDVHRPDRRRGRLC